jgi:hypothetical protein
MWARASIGRGHGEDADIGHVLGQGIGRLHGLGGQRAGIDDGQLGLRPRFAKPVAAVDDPLVFGRPQAPARLIEGARGQAQIYRATFRITQPRGRRLALAVALQVIERPLQDHRKLVGVSRLEAGQAVLRHADERRVDRLVGAAFGRQGDARRRSDDDETGILVAGIVQGIQAARDKGVVEGTDGQQAGAEQRMAKT